MLNWTPAGAGGNMTVFTPTHFTFHAPSEHSIEGNFYDLELQIEHRYAEDGWLGAMVSVFFDRVAGGNRDNPFFDELFDRTLDRVNITLHTMMRGMNVTTIDYWNYDGSLTTPPCT